MKRRITIEHLAGMVKRGFDDVKRGQDDIRQILNNTRNQELQSILELIHTGNISREEMGRTLQIIEQSLTILLENNDKLSAE